ncbi:hypothetical protein [Alkalibacterium sp.]
MGTNDTGDLTDLRRDILSGFETLPLQTNGCLNPRDSSLCT